MLGWIYSRSTCQVGEPVMWVPWVIGVSKPWEGPQDPMYSENSAWTRMTCKCENKFCASGFQAYSKNGNEESKFQWVVIISRSMEKELNWSTRTMPRLTFNIQLWESGQEVQIMNAEWKWMVFTFFQDFCIWKKSFYVVIFNVILSTFNKDTYFEYLLSSWDHTMKHKRNTDSEAIKSQSFQWKRDGWSIEAKLIIPTPISK